MLYVVLPQFSRLYYYRQTSFFNHSESWYYNNEIQHHLWWITRSCLHRKQSDTASNLTHILYVLTDSINEYSGTKCMKHISYQSTTLISDLFKWYKCKDINIMWGIWAFFFLSTILKLMSKNWTLEFQNNDKKHSGFQFDDVPAAQE